MILAGVVLTLAITAITYLSLVPIDLTSYNASLEASIKKKTGLDVTLTGVVIKALPYPDVTITGVELKDGDSTLAAIPTMRIRLSLFQLIAANLVVKELVLEGPKAMIQRDAAGRLNLLTLAGRLKAGPERGQRASLVRKIVVRGGEISLRDRIRDGYGATDVTGLKVDFTNSREGIMGFEVQAVILPATRLSFKGRGQRYTNRIRLEAEGSLDEIDLKRLTPLIAARAPRAKLSGSAGITWSFTLDKTARLEGTITYKDVVANYPDMFKKPFTAGDGSTRVLAIRDKGGLMLALSDLKLNLDGFDISGSAAVSGLLSGEDRRFSLALSTTPVPFKRVNSLLPEKALNKRTVRSIALIKPISGAVTVDEFTMTGSLGEIKDFEALKRAGGVSLKVSLENLNFNYGSLKETFSGINGSVMLKDDTLSFSGMRGNYGHGVVERLSADIKDYNSRKPLYTVSLKAFFEAEKTLEIVKALYGGKSKAPEALYRVEASGLTDVEIKAGGSLKDPAPSSYSGSITLKEARFSHPALPVPLRSLSGVVVFDESNLQLNDLSFKDLYSDFKLDGSVTDYTKKDPYFDVKAEGSLSRGTLVKLVKSKATDEIIFNGTIGFTAAAKGSKRALSADAIADLTWTDLNFKKIIEKASGFPMKTKGSWTLSTKSSGEGKAERTLRLKDMSVDIGGSRASVSGEFLPDGGYRFTAESVGMNISDLDDVTPYLMTDFGSSGVVRFDTLISKKDKNASAAFEGRVKLEEARFHTIFSMVPVEKLNAEARLDRRSASLKIAELKTGRSDLAGTLAITKKKEWTVKFDLLSSGFYLEDFLKKGVKKEAEEAKDKQKAPGISALLPGRVTAGGGSIRIKEGGVYGQTFKDVSITVNIDSNAVYLEPIVFVKNSGPVQATATYYRHPASPYLFDADVEFSGVRTEELIREFGTEKRIMEGRLSGNGTIWCKKGKAPALACLNGEVYLNAEKGKLWKFLLFSKIFSIVNILSIDELFKEGLPYKFIAGDFSIRDGVISSNNLVFDSDSLRMSAIGDISLPDSYIDAILAQHPFVTIDKIVTSIPLAGWIIGGEKKSTISMYYEIVGPLKNPLTEPVPIKGLQEGVIGILQRMIDRPLEALRKGLEGNGAEPPKR